MSFSWKDIWHITKRWWWLLVLGTVLAGSVSYYVSSRKPKIYAARATLQVGSATQVANVDERTLGLTRTLARVYSDHVRRRSVTQAVVENLGLQMSHGELASRIQTNVIESSSLLEIFVFDTRPEWAAILANAVAEELIRQSPGDSSGELAQERQFARAQLSEFRAKIQEVESQIQELRDSVLDMTSAAEIADANARINELQQVQRDYQSTYAQYLELLNSQNVNTLSLIEPAVEVYTPVSPNVKKDTAIATAAGLALAVLAVVVLEFLDDTLHVVGSSSETVERMPVLGTVARLSGQRDKVIVRGQPRSPEAEAVRQLRTNVMLTSPSGKLRSLSVTSPQAKDGKTNTVANLGVALAASGMRVVMIDGDVRSPALHELFDQPNLFGLAELVSADREACERQLDQALRDTDTDHLSLITAGRPPLDPSVLLTSPRMPELMMSLQQRFDIVILDSPPVPVAPDATVLASLVEGTLLVVCPGRTSRSTTRRSRDQLEKNQEVTLLGAVLNRVTLSHHVYSYTPAETTAGQSSGRLAALKKWLWERLDGSSDDEFVSLSQAAKTLGVRRETAKRWHREGRLPAVRKGLFWRVHREDLQALLDDTSPAINRVTVPESSPAPAAGDNGREAFWIPLREAAERLGLDEADVQARCEAGELTAVQRNGRWWVDEAKLEIILTAEPKSEA